MCKLQLIKTYFSSFELTLPLTSSNLDRKSTRLNSSHCCGSRMQSSAWKKKSPTVYYSLFCTSLFPFIFLFLLFSRSFISCSFFDIHFVFKISLAPFQVDTYLQLKGTQLEREMAAEIILHILDKVMQNTQSLNSQQVSALNSSMTFFHCNLWAEKFKLLKHTFLTA